MAEENTAPEVTPEIEIENKTAQLSAEEDKIQIALREKEKDREIEQLKRIVAGETKKTQQHAIELERVKTEKMTESERAAFELEKYKKEVDDLKVAMEEKEKEIERKQECNLILKEYSLSVNEFELVYDLTPEKMKTKAEALNEIIKTRVDKAIAELRGSPDVGKPGNGSSVITTEVSQTLSEKTAMYQKIKEEKGERAAKAWFNNN